VKGRFFLTGFILLLLFTVAVTQTAPSQDDNGEDSLLSVDIIVVGSGIPALTAALEATRLGAEVLLLDNAALRDEFPPPLGGRFVAFEPAEEPAEEEQGEELRLLESIQRASPGIEKTLLTELLQAGRETLEWLTLETGLSFSFTGEDPYHVYDPVFTDPDLLAEELRTALLPRLAVMIPDGEPLEILVSPGGNVEGLRFLDRRGKANTVMAQAMILATGGAVGNSEFMQAYAPSLASVPFTGRQSGTGGEAFALTRPLRARVSHGERVLVSPVLHPLGMAVTPPNYPRVGQGYWFTAAGSDVTAAAVQAMTGGERSLRVFLEGQEGVYLLFAGGQQEAWPGLRRINTVLELAEYTGISLEACEEISRRLPLPYALGRLELELFYSMGGLAAGANGQVMGPIRPILGLYALGEAVGNLHGEGIYPGLPLTEALVAGRSVGREAAFFSRR
jgi:urocanate reductase